jgi:hypothetical protein
MTDLNPVPTLGANGNGRRLSPTEEAFVLGVVSNLFSAALIYLVATATGLITTHGKGISGTAVIALLFVTWGFYGALIERGRNSLSTGLAGALTVGALVIEVIVLKHNGHGWSTAWITIVTLLAASAPSIAIGRAMGWPGNRS